jgi:putative ABC transport system substrate-binding protein
MFSVREYLIFGGLMSYGPNRLDMFRRAATYVDKILNGARPADLPIEQPTVFDFVVNLETARALGVTFSDPVLAQTTEIMQSGGDERTGD